MSTNNNSDTPMSPTAKYARKAIDIINEKIQKKETFYSFEYFPPKTEKGLENLYDRLERMKLLGPAWIDCTWGAGGSTSTLTQEIVNNAQNYVGLESMMHLTCTNMDIQKIHSALKECKENGVRNILALRGDPPVGQEWKKTEGGFEHAVDLVRHIRKEYGNWFGIAVAGYPEKHMDCPSYETDLKYLKEKVDAGADLIVTQLFYDADKFLKFVQDCRDLGINCPIIPGIMPIHGYAGFKKMTSFCQTFIPKEVEQALEPIQGNDEAVKTYGVKYVTEMCKKLLDAGIPGLHFYTLNLEKSTVQILQNLNLCSELRKPLPWHSIRDLTKEDVRPIFWANRPKSYINRTLTWDEFPNGRWGDSESPAFGSLTDFHLGVLHGQPVEARRKLWGETCTSVQDLCRVFTSYLRGEVEKLPWSDAPPSGEANLIKEELMFLNENGFFTINSQPRINGVSSNDPVHGWGPENGYVYQKAYLEFFCSEELFKKLLSCIASFPNLAYHAVKKDPKSVIHCTKENTVTAVTWGVFPNHEIRQPTVVDYNAFLVWKEEAFLLWDVWINTYPESSPSNKFLKEVSDSFYLVNLVDNNFVNSNIFDIFRRIIKKD